jgi:uncharacterized membrane protein YhaH (DUF805 family)
MHYFIEVLKKYAIFKGRARRAEYWYFTLVSTIISVVINVISNIFSDKQNIIGLVYSLAVFIPGLAVSVRRLHDIGKSGWMILINLIPLVGFIWFIVLACKDSNPGENKYGPNSKMQPASTSPTPPVAPTPVQ